MTIDMFIIKETKFIFKSENIFYDDFIIFKYMQKLKKLEPCNNNNITDFESKIL